MHTYKVYLSEMFFVMIKADDVRLATGNSDFVFVFIVKTEDGKEEAKGSFVASNICGYIVDDEEDK